MRIDFATLAFGYRVRVGGGTPNWATALGQGSEHKINNSPAIDEMLKGIVYSSVPLEKVTTKIGKGGRVVNGGAPGSPIVMAACFSKVYVNDDLIPGGKFILLITRDDSESHAGRLRLKYGPSNTFTDDGSSYSNQGLFEKIRKQLSLADDACWFVSNIRIRNQNELILKTSVVNPNGTTEYEDSAALHAAWNAFDSDEEEGFDSNSNVVDESADPIESRILAKYDEIKGSLPDYDSFYQAFRDKFSPSILNSLDGEDLLKSMFLSGDNKDNMCWWLEFHPQIREYFGSIKSGTAYKYGLFFSKDKNSWVTGSSQKPQLLTLQEAIELGTSIRNALVKSTDYINNLGAVSTIEEYFVIDKKINEIMGDANKVWIQKYLHMIFPNLFSTFNNDAWQNHVLYSCGMMPKDGRYVRSGQISLFTNSLGICNAAFAQVVYQLFGLPKQFIRLGTSDSNGNYFSDWVANGYAAIGWTGLGDLSQIADEKNSLSKELIIDKMQELYYVDDKRTASRKSGEICDFYNSTKDTTYFVAMNGKALFAVGQVVGDYYLDSNKPLGHCKSVKWVHRFTDAELPVSEGIQTTCYEIGEQQNLLFLYKALLNNNAEVDDIDDEIIEDEEESVEMIDRQPRTHKSHDLNCIIYGAPGTGKTYSTVQYAVDVCNDKPTDFAPITKEARDEYKSKYDELVAQGRVVFTTFHQSYGYEDFIQGLRPDTKSQTIKFIPVDGVFKKIADKAMMDTENDYVIIIDEINRGNISKIFGELITLIEDDKRWGENNQLCVSLPSGQKFAVPNNLYIVGTMNSADKSISLIDAALRRRFQFQEQSPNPELLTDDALKTVLKNLNEALEKELDSTDLLIGHSYFIGKDASDLCQIMNRSIIPLLYEYFFDNSKKVRNILKSALEGQNVELVEGSCSRIKIKNKD